MSQLQIACLGKFEVARSGERLSGFDSDRVRILLVYLLLARKKACRRETLAGLFWPNEAERTARTNLRSALANLRRVIDDHAANPPYLLITRKTIQFNEKSDYRADVVQLEQHAGQKQPTMAQLKEAAALARGSFLTGFSVADSSALDEWLLLTREQIDRQITAVWQQLAHRLEQVGSFNEAITYCRKLVQQEPFQETFHRQLMRMLVFDNQRNEALSHYETLCSLLDAELNIAPEPQTSRLWQQIRDGRLSAPPPLPAFLAGTTAVSTPAAPRFVARHKEMEKLLTMLGKARSRQGQIAFISGEAGSGKTALMRAFARQAENINPDIRVVSGRGQAYIGMGDPYHPFRTILQQLAGDVEGGWQAGAISTDRAQRLWSVFPLLAQSLVAEAPDLIGTFIPEQIVRQRLRATTRLDEPWVEDLQQLVGGKTAVAPETPLTQPALFTQYTQLIRHISADIPLLVLLDDLQWADVGSISLLFHLVRGIVDAPVFIIGAYRPEAIPKSQNEPHPLPSMVHDLQRDFGDIQLPLYRADHAQFVDEWLDSEPNQLGAAFRRALVQQTRGNALFTVELVQTLQDQKQLLKNAAGEWTARPSLDWGALPPRVEGAIAGRVTRLPSALQEALRLAAVAGEQFSLEVVARLQQAEPESLKMQLDDLTAEPNHLIQKQQMQQVNGRFLTFYRFRHNLFQTYLYGTLSSSRQVALHKDVGLALETLYADEANAIAVQLAHHFMKAAMPAKAVTYLHQAAEQAKRLSANEDAIAHLRRALALLPQTPDTPERAEQEITLQLALRAPLIAARGYASPELENVHRRAYELCQQLGETPQLIPTLNLVLVFYATRGLYQRAFEVSERLLSLAQLSGDAVAIAASRWMVGWQLVMLGRHEEALVHLDHVIHFYDQTQHADLAHVYGQDMGVSVLAWSAWALYLLGRYEQAQQRAQEAIDLAETLEHPFTLSFAYAIAEAMFQQLCGNLEKALSHHSPPTGPDDAGGFPVLDTGSIFFEGLRLIRAGDQKAGIAHMEQALTIWRSMGLGMHMTHYLGVLGWHYGRLGSDEKAIETIDQALALVESNGERYYEPELYRLKGLLLLPDNIEMRPDETAEANFLQAIRIAQAQGAKMWELRATLTLAYHWQAQEKYDAAQKILHTLVNQFNGGLRVPEYQEACGLLATLNAQ